MVSPAPPSNSTLSGTTTAALPWGFNSVLICCTKFNCLLDVVAQKSSRSMMSFLVEVLPSSPTIIVLDFLPIGGLASTASNRSPGSAASALAPDPQPFPPSIGIPGVLLETRFAFAAECPHNDSRESGTEDPAIDCQCHLYRHPIAVGCNVLRPRFVTHRDRHRLHPPSASTQELYPDATTPATPRQRVPEVGANSSAMR